MPNIKYVLFFVFASFFVVAPQTEAHHAWGGYHWARTANPFTIQVGDSVQPQYDKILASTTAEWNKSSVMDFVVVPGRGKRALCPFVNGRVEACSYFYGKIGWTGLTILNVDADNHILRGVIKMNNSYLLNTATETSPYATIAWRKQTFCHELGHTIGLDHHDNDFYDPNTFSCLDTNYSATKNQKPNQHDYDELEEIYAHTDSTNTMRPFGDTSPEELGEGGVGVESLATLDELSKEGLSHPSAWGKLMSQDKATHSAVYERKLKDGTKLVTFVHLVPAETPPSE